MKGVLAVLVTVIALAPAAATGAELSRDPFRVPDGYAPVSGAEQGQPNGPHRLLDVRGILLAGKTSLVNVGGKIVGIGEEVDGYRLVAVRESEAVFQKGPERTTVPVQPEDKDQE